jgi:periplasmic protein TonB
MFEPSLSPSWDGRSRRGLTTLTSLGVQALVVGVLLIGSLLQPQGLPIFRQLCTPVTLGRPLTEPPTPRPRIGSGNPAPTNTPEIIFRQPAQIPRGIHIGGNEDSTQLPGPGPYIPGLMTGVGNSDGLSVLGSGTRPIMPVVPAPIAHTLRLSHMSEGDLIRKVQPIYPPLARSARIQGTVVLQAVISKQGTIENLRLLSGHPMLAPAAIDAVRQWRYRAYILNGEAVEVETQITVNFSLAGN